MNGIYDPGLVLYLPLYEMNGESLVSKDARGHSCIVDGPVWNPSGRNFDGVDDVLNCGDDICLDLVHQITVLAWIRPTVLGAAYHTVVARDDAVNRNYTLFISDEQIIVFRPVSGGAGKTASTAGKSVALHNWYCIGGSYDGKTTRAWLDGIEGANTSEWCGTIDNDDVSLTVGARGNGDWQFAGEIGEVLIYNRALTAPEILNYYLATRWRYK